MQRRKAVLIGSGNIGTDLMYKALRSPSIEPVWMIGIDAASDGLRRARESGLQTSDAGLAPVLSRLVAEGVEVAFDATSAYVHREHARLLESVRIPTIDLTPAAIGPYCVPPVNLHALAAQRHLNVNMVSCGGQATIPIVAAVSRAQRVEYAEIVATVASRSAGPGTRLNIDEFTRTTARGLEQVGGAARGKAIIILNPAEPPLIMRDTVHCITAEAPERDRIAESIASMLATVQTYVPGYRLKAGPVFDGRRVSVYLEVAGLGDYLPAYAGNLDIMTAAALRTAEMIAAEPSDHRVDATATAVAHG